MMRAKTIIRKEYGNSPNFMTPTVLDYGFVNDNIAYELSKGTGIFSGEIFGVSVVKLHADGHTERLGDVSKCLDSLEEAKSYISGLDIN